MQKSIFYHTVLACFKLIGLDNFVRGYGWANESGGTNYYIYGITSDKNSKKEKLT